MILVMTTAYSGPQVLLGDSGLVRTTCYFKKQNKYPLKCSGLFKICAHVNKTVKRFNLFCLAGAHNIPLSFKLLFVRSRYLCEHTIVLLTS